MFYSLVETQGRLGVVQEAVISSIEVPMMSPRVVTRYGSSALPTKPLSGRH